MRLLMLRSDAAERGQGMVEFAVVFPIFIILVFIMFDGGVLMGRYNQVNHAAQEGARSAATGNDLSVIVSRVRAQSVGLLSPLPVTCADVTQRICVEWFDGANSVGEVGSAVRVSVRYDYNLQTPIKNNLFGSVGIPGHFDVDACAIATLERPIAPPAGNQRSGSPQC
jgi:Flp pilus assembly protein TadG